MRFLQREISRGRVSLMELLKRLTETRLGRRQRMLARNGPPMLVSERSNSVTVVFDTASQVTPNQLQGVASREFHEESLESGSSKESFSW